MGKERWVLPAISSIPLVMTLGNSMLIPVIPLIEQELNLTTFQGSLIITVYSIIAVVFIPVAGFLSDRVGRKVVILPGLALAGLGGLLSGLAAALVEEPYYIILAARLLQGIGAAGAFPIVLPLIRDLYQKEEDISHALGVIETSNTFGKVLSPILGSYLALISWYAPFLSIPILSLISIIAIAFIVKTDSKKPDSTNVNQFLKKLKAIFIQEKRWLITVYLVGCIIMLTLFGTLFYLSEILEQQYAIKTVIKGYVLAIPLACLCLASYLAGRFIGKEKKTMKWVAFVGMLISALASLAISFSGNIYFIIIGLAIGCTGVGVTLPSLDALITASIDKEHNGTVTSFYNSMRFVGVAIGPPIFALLMQYSHQLVFWVGAGFSTIAVIAIIKYIRTAK